MTLPTITNYPIYTPPTLQPYERYLTSAFDDSLSHLEKLNKVIQSLMDLGVTTNGMITNFNNLSSWLLNEGLNAATVDALNKWIEDGTLNFIVDQKGVVVDGLLSNANYWNPNDLKWYQDAMFTTLAHDNTATLQNYLNQYDHVVIPAGSYMTGSLQYKDNQIIEGTGLTMLCFADGVGIQKNFPKAILTNTNQPTYHAPEDSNREYKENLNKNITVRNLSLHGSNIAIWCLQLIGVDKANIQDVKMFYAQGALDLRAVTNSYFGVLYVENITDDAISLTDQNFKPAPGKRGITTNLLFENCYVTAEGSHNDGGTGKSAYELDDGMSYITFKNCTAINNNGRGFEMHIHTNEYDIHHITFDNCRAINNTPLSGISPYGVAGFEVGQCPVGSYLGDITFLNCDSIGNYVSAFRRNPGSQLGTVYNITIDGGRWETTYAGEGTRDTNFCCIWVGKQFDNFKILNANIKGCKDAFGIYSYDRAGKILIEGCTFDDSYIPIDLNHEGGDSIINNNIINFSDYVTIPFTACIYADGDKMTFTNNTLYVDANRYSGSVIRFQTLGIAKVQNNTIVNTGLQNNNGIYIQDNEVSQIINNVIKNFTNAIFMSGANVSTIAALNNCIQSGAIVNTPGASGLILSNNAV